MSRALEWLSETIRYLRLAWRLRPLAPDRRSLLSLLYLGGTTMLRSRPRLLRKPVWLRLRLGDGVFRVGLETRTELDTLLEIGIEDEYGLADQIPAKTIVDLGASVGLATLRLLSSHPEAEVLAVEADPILIPRLQANVAGLPVTVVHAAVSGEEGERTFYRSDLDSWGNSLDNTEDSQEAVRVPARKLASLLDGAGIERVDLLKMDIEGAEWEVLQEGPPDRVEAIVGEVHGRDDEPETLIDVLRGSMDVKMLSAEPGRATFVAKKRSG